MLKNNIVSKANELNLRAYKLTRLEQMVILSIASMIQPEDKDFKEYKLSIKDFLELLEIKDKSKYNQLPKITKGLMKKVIEIKRPHGLLQVAWLCSVEYNNLEGSISVQFAPKLKPYLLNLKKNFVSYKLYNVSKLTSKYSIRVYELLKQYEFQKVINFTLAEFRLLIGLDEFEYPRYSNFKQIILLRANKELKEKTDIYFDFKEFKTGRKVTSLKFYIYPNKKNYNSDNELSATLEPIKQIKGQLDVKNYELIDQVNQVKKKLFNNDIKLSDSDIHTLLKLADNDINKIKKAFEVLHNYRKYKTIDNVMGFLCFAIQEDWNKGQSIIKQDKPASKFINFKQRDDWDFEEIERKEREYLEKQLENNNY